jgi:FKBP-type peptidyl-prolyl cis-trans isomerase
MRTATKRMVRTAVVAAVALAACAKTGTPATPELKTDDEKTFYALGLFEAQRMATFSLNEHELQIVLAGIADGTLGRKPAVELSAWQQKIQPLFEARRKAAGSAQASKAQGFLDQAAKEPGAQKTESGAVYVIEREGTGPTPAPTDTVKVNYEGKLVDGTVFDSSYQRGQPAEFPLNGVIRCWTEGVQKIKVGGKAKLTCPSNLAYGDGGMPPKIPPGATLVFEVELLEIKPH